MRNRDLRARVRELERWSWPKLEAELRAAEDRMRARETIWEWGAFWERYWSLQVVFWSIEGNPLCPDPETQKARYNEAVSSQRRALRGVEAARELIGDDSVESEAGDISLLRQGDGRIHQRMPESRRGSDEPGRWAREWEGDWRARKWTAWTREPSAEELLDSMWRDDPRGLGRTSKETWLREILDPCLRDFIVEQHG